MRFRRMVTLGIVVCASLYLLVCGILFVFQRSLIYYPQPRANLIASSLMTLQVSDATVNVSVQPHAGPAAVIYYGGNAEDVSKTMPGLKTAFPDKAIYALHYPGYGGSSGNPSQDAIFQAALALFDKAHAEHQHVVVIGRSLGSGVAVWVASQRPLDRLVLITPFDSIADVAEAQYSFLPVRWLLRDKFDSWKYAPRVTAPTLMLVAQEDELVPRSSSDRLRNRFRAGTVLYDVLAHVGHNNIQTDPHYWPLVKGD